MCDEFTEGAENRALARKGLTRREFAAIGAAVAITGCAGGESAASATADLVEDTVRITTEDGVADAFFVHPASGAHPGIITWPDIAGLRDVFKIMARRLASAGYAVLAVNQYYRGGPAPILDSFSQWRTDAGQARIGPMREALTPEAIARDAKAFVAYLDGQDAVDKGRGIGTNGYCMGGPFTVRTAAAVPGRVKAAASLHGAWLVGDEPDSPVNLIDDTRAAFLFAIARGDDERAPGDKEALKKAAEAAGRPAEVVVYPADHGWCVPDTPVYDPVQADLAWEQMTGLFAAL